MSSVVTTLLETRKTLIVSAAAVSSRFAPAIRPRGCSSVSPGAPAICGITATPVSKPDSPSASLGNTRRATATTISGSACEVVRAACQSVTTDGWVTTW